jgi:hypothetical protein
MKFVRIFALVLFVLPVVAQSQQRDRSRCADPDTPSEQQSDCRNSLEGAVFIGAAVDTFAGGETIKYLNPNASSGTETREIVGFDFEYRLIGQRSLLADDECKDCGRLGRSQLWVFGEAMHGLRSAEVDCTKPVNKGIAICTESGFDAANTAKGIIAILRGASSLEGLVGFRWEFAPLSQLLQADEMDRARMYLKVQSGFVSVAGGGDARDLHHAAIGATAVSGPFNGSYLEFGYGRNDLLETKKNGRFKIDAFFSLHPHYIPLPGFTKISPRVRPFAQLVADVDFGGAADSIESFFGVDLTFSKPSP